MREKPEAAPTATEMLVCSRGGMPHQEQTGRRMTQVTSTGGAKDERHGAVAAAMATQLRRVVVKHQSAVLEKRLGHLTKVADQPADVTQERAINAMAPSADVLPSRRCGATATAGSMATDYTVRVRKVRFHGLCCGLRD